MKQLHGLARSTVGARAALAFAILAISGTAVAQGTAPAFSVNRVECEWLDVDEFTRLLELELTYTGSGVDLPPLTVDLSCGEQGITIIVRDPEWTQQIERTVPSPEVEGPGRERQLALTVAQFAGALWRLREVAEQEAAEQPGPEEPSAEPEPHEAQLPPAVFEPTAAVETAWFLELGGGLRGRALESRALLSGYGELSGVLWLAERLGAVALLAVEGARADRQGGTVGAVAVTAGLGLAGLLAEAVRFRLESRLLLTGGYVRFEGQASDPSSYRDASTDGSTGEVRIELAPSLRLGRFQPALVIQAGYALPVTIAVVREDDDVSFSGWWVGGGLRIGLGFGSAEA